MQYFYVMDGINIKLRNIREQKGFSQEYVANELGIKQAAYSKIESGKSDITVKRLYEVCNLFEYDVFAVLDGNINKSVGIIKSKVTIELELSPNDIIKLGLKERVINQLK